MSVLHISYKAAYFYSWIDSLTLTVFWVHKHVYTGGERPAVDDVQCPLASLHLWSAMFHPKHPLENTVMKLMKREEKKKNLSCAKHLYHECLCCHAYIYISKVGESTIHIHGKLWCLDHTETLLVPPEDTGLPMLFAHAHRHRRWLSFPLFMFDLRLLLTCIWHNIHLLSS